MSDYSRRLIGALLIAYSLLFVVSCIQTWRDRADSDARAAQMEARRPW